MILSLTLPLELETSVGQLELMLICITGKANAVRRNGYAPDWCYANAWCGQIYVVDLIRMIELVRNNRRETY